MSTLKQEIKEIVEVLQEVPDQFKAQCFELMLKDVLESRRGMPASSRHPGVPASPPPKATAEPKADERAVHSTEDRSSRNLPKQQPSVASGSDILLTDLHMKTKRFMEKNGVTIEELNGLFYKDGDRYEALYTDLGVTGFAEGQLRIALLQSLHQSLSDGEFATTVERVREECKMRKTYDSGNFTKNFKNNANLFDFGEWTTDVVDLRLSEEGRKALAAAIKSVS